MMLEPEKILTRAKELISEPDRWVKGAYSLDKNFNHVHRNDPKACKWCLSGSIEAATEMLAVSTRSDIFLYLSEEYIEAKRVLLKMSDLDGFPSISQWNDHPDRTHEEVIDLLDRAIASDTGNSQQQEARQ